MALSVVLDTPSFSHTVSSGSWKCWERTAVRGSARGGSWPETGEQDKPGPALAAGMDLGEKLSRHDDIFARRESPPKTDLLRRALSGFKILGLKAAIFAPAAVNVASRVLVALPLALTCRNLCPAGPLLRAVRP